MKTITKKFVDLVKMGSEQFAARVLQKCEPLYVVGKEYPETKAVDRALNGLGMEPYPAQRFGLYAFARLWERVRVMVACYRQGCGKTFTGGAMANIALHLEKDRPQRVLVTMPPTLVSTWERELKRLYGNTVDIINANGPNALTLLKRAWLRRGQAPMKHEFWLIGFNRAKTSFKWEPKYTVKRKYYRTTPGGINHDLLEMCSDCGSSLDPENVNLFSRSFCPNCGSPLWGPEGIDGGGYLEHLVRTASLGGDWTDPTRLNNILGTQASQFRKKLTRRFAPVLYIKKHLKGYFDLLIADEVHKMKGAATIQGALLGQLASVCRKSLLLTGTISGGKASEIFHLIFRALALNMTKEEREELLPFGHGDVMQFVREYGTLEEFFVCKDEDKLTGRASKDDTHVKEKPGISPLALLRFFLGCTVFMSIEDIADALPGYDEQIEVYPLPSDLAASYEKFQTTLKEAARAALRNKDKTVLGQMQAALLGWPDIPSMDLKIHNKEWSIVAETTPHDVVTDKAHALVSHIRGNKLAGRGVLVYFDLTGERYDTLTHYRDFLVSQGLNPLVLTPGVASEKRLDWIERHWASGKYDCLICNMKLVEVGLNLLQFPEIICYQTGFSTYVLRQAIRRSYRPGQTQDVRVRFMLHGGTMQEVAMSLIARKFESSLLFEGEIPEDGLATFDQDDDSLVVELTKALVGHVNVESLEKQFASYKALQSRASRRINATAIKQPQPIVTTTVETVTTTRTTTTIGGNLRKQTFAVVRKEVRTVGEVTFGPGSTQANGTLFSRKALFKEGDVLVGGKLVGKYDEQGSITLNKTPERLVHLEPKPALPGFTAWRVVEAVQGQ